MKIFVGLANPGREYEITRHNIGFIAIDELANRWSIPLNQQKFKGVFTSGIVNGEKVIFSKASYIYEFIWKISVRSWIILELI